MSELLSFAIIAFMLVLSPGPNAVLVLKTLGQSGQRAVNIQLLGICTATFFHGLLSALGMSALMLQSAELYSAVKFLGAAYLAYLGGKALWQSLRPATKKIKQSSSQVAPPVRQQTFWASFGEGFITQILNPKVSMFYLAAFPQFLSPEGPVVGQAAALVAIHAGMIFIWFSFVSRILVRFQRGPSKARFDRWVQGISGAVMVYFSALIVTSK